MFEAPYRWTSVKGGAHTYFVDAGLSTTRMSPALNRSSAIQHFKGNNVIKIRNGITFDFYTGLPHTYSTTLSICEQIYLHWGFVEFSCVDISLGPVQQVMYTQVVIEKKKLPIVAIATGYYPFYETYRGTGRQTNKSTATKSFFTLRPSFFAQQRCYIITCLLHLIPFPSLLPSSSFSSSLHSSFLLTSPLLSPPLAGSFQGRKLLQISRFCSYPRKFSPWIGDVASFGNDTSEQSVKIFSAKILFLPNYESFFPRKFAAIRYLLCFPQKFVKWKHMLW